MTPGVEYEAVFDGIYCFYSFVFGGLRAAGGAGAETA
jgi:hypothetical protein